MSIDTIQTSFINKDELSKKLDSFPIELNNYGYFKERSNRIIRNDMLNNFKFTIIKKGECCIYNKEQRIQMKAHDVVLVSPFGFYSAEGTGEEPLEFYYFRFNITDPKIRLNFMSFFHLSGINIYRNLVDDQMIEELQLADKEMNNSIPGYFFHQELILKRLLLNIVHQMTSSLDNNKLTSKNSAEETTIIQCLMYIDEHIKENIKVDDLCSYLNVSQSYLYRCFQNNLGISTKEYLNRYRMRYICSDLQFSTMSIKEIADKYSYPSAYAFTNAFKAMFHVSPSAYRSKEK